MNAIFLHLRFVLTKPDDTICHQIENNLQNEIVLICRNVLKAGATHSYVVAFPKTMGHPTSMEIVWTRDLSWWRVITKV